MLPLRPLLCSSKRHVSHGHRPPQRNDWTRRLFPSFCLALNTLLGWLLGILLFIYTYMCVCVCVCVCVYFFLSRCFSLWFTRKAENRVVCAFFLPFFFYFTFQFFLFFKIKEEIAPEKNELGDVRKENHVIVTSLAQKNGEIGGEKYPLFIVLRITENLML